MSNRSWVVILLAAMLLPGAQAHGAAPPAEYATRLLADCVDDWFGGDSSGEGADAGYDLHALDLHEVYDDSLGRALVFSVVMNGDGAADIVVRVTIDGQAKTIGWKTSNGDTWSDQGFDKIIGPQPAFDKSGQSQDGERFWMRGLLGLQSNGWAVGDKISGWTVEDRYDGGRDAMPGAQTKDAILEPECFQSEDRTAPYERQASYAVAGPGEYATLDITPPSGALPVGTERFIDVDLKNLLGDHDQEFTLTYNGGAGLDVRFHDPSSGGYSQEATVFVAGGQSNLVHLAVNGEEPGASGTITVTLRTDLGGYTTDSMTYSVAQAGGTTGPTTTPPDGDNGTPAPAALTLLVLLGALLVRRR